MLDQDTLPSEDKAEFGDETLRGETANWKCVLTHLPLKTL